MAAGFNLPSIYLLSSVDDDERSRLAAQVSSLTTDTGKADFFIGKVSKTERAKFELRRLGIATIDESRPSSSRAKATQSQLSGPNAKRQKLDRPVPDTIVISSSSDDDEPTPTPVPQGLLIKVVKLGWLTESIARGEVLPLGGYVVYEGRKAPAQPTRKRPASSHAAPESAESAELRVQGILQRAQTDVTGSVKTPPSVQHQHQRHAHSSPIQGAHRRTAGHARPPPALLRVTTTESDSGSREMPQIPASLHTIYSCQRPTPIHPPNEKFVDQLKKIWTARQLTGDKIGIRAYSTAIAAISAYPHAIAHHSVVGQLPGCGPKIEDLFREFQDTGGHVREADDDNADPKMASLRIFHKILGVAEATARSFYNKGWRDLDDVVEFGWNDLTRVQQIGVKFYDELQEAIARPQVEAIANTVLAHANAIRPGYEMVIAGGYRRGKELSGDVDIIISHRDETATHLLAGRLVLALEQDRLVTHTLILSTANSERGQEALSWKGNAPKHGLTPGTSGRGGGFDTLDKALVVWQDPMEDEGEDEDATERGGGDGDGGGKPPKRNTNPHRRVDIIISPWKTVGCAVLGWTGGTTFQRDLRRYCKYERGLRFDSSGARSTADGSWVDLERYGQDPAPDMLTAERRVFEALGLEYRAPTERCTG